MILRENLLKCYHYCPRTSILSSLNFFRFYREPGAEKTGIPGPRLPVPGPALEKGTRKHEHNIKTKNERQWDQFERAMGPKMTAQLNKFRPSDLKRSCSATLAKSACP